MAINIIRQVKTSILVKKNGIVELRMQVATRCQHILTNKVSRSYSLYMPPYLEKEEKEVPEYETLNIQIKGYVFPVLESYQRFISKVATIMDIDVEDSFPFPHQEFKVNKFKKASTVTECEYTLKIYERDIQISNLSSIKCPIFIRVLEAALPEGVSLNIDKYDPEIQNRRYIPDKGLLDLKSELQTLRPGHK